MLDFLVKYGVINQSTSNQMALAWTSLLEPNRPIILVATFIAAFILIFGLSQRSVLKSFIAGFAATLVLISYFVMTSVS